ncbi:SDR family NAD(P)-dependent oxidoreductase [Brevibacterium sp. CFH 10365]|uniref:SDR family NAD(P)-dependent oxidoreductase n=1 Tax=Brevibacterium sp. CFH 10365 TaxID=2585207 RepID=UPI001D0D51F1|nr:SDR family oxidoreductase [Brevibacterium sp. CFH 10365]
MTAAGLATEVAPESTQTFEGRTAVVTGAASGIGAAIAEMLARRGAKVMIGDISEQAQQRADDLAADGLQVAAIPTDASSEEDVEALMDHASTTFGGLDILVANAGIAEPKAPIDDLDVARWRQIIDINLTGTALCFKHALRYMRSVGSGSIVAVASILGLVGQARSTSYSASKAAIVNLVRSTGLTYAQDGIRVNAVAPGYVDTPLVAGLDKSVREKMIERMPNCRLGTPEEVAEVVCFLASDAAPFVNAATWSVDGGYVAQ